MQDQKITDQSPVIRLPQSHHRKAKAWAALRGLSLREAICLLIDLVYATQSPDVIELRAQLIVEETGGHK